MSLILCYCEKCEHINAISDKELNNIETEVCVSCDNTGYYKIKQANTPKCPTCQSTNIEKVSGASKAFSVAMFGLLSQKVKKQFHCNNCGYKW